MRNVKKYWDKLHDDKQLWFQWWQYSGIHLKGANPMREPASIIYLQMVNLCEKLISCITKVGCDGPRRSVAERSHPTPRVRGGGREELPHAQGQGRRPRGAIPCPRSCGCASAGGLRGATPHSRAGGAAVRRCPSSKVRSSRKEIPHV